MRKTSMKSMMRALVLCAAMATAVAAASPAVLARGGLQGVKIFIDPGHGGPEPGAIGPSGLRESDVNLRVATALRNCLVEYGGATVKMSRTGDVDVSLGERTAAANYWGADRFISIHHNASYSWSYNATETYAYTYADWTALDLRNKVHRRLVAGLGLPDGGARTANFYVLRNTWMPAILTEASYISNPYQEARLKDMGYTWREGYYIYLGIADHFGVAP
ncbi:MAG: N-acetylmuramoyl-L-alanine amidase [Bacillota bacterium]|nr:N-acetylmuramoyl-L-alanine amidase [Bacillota bacterium]